MSLNFTDFDVGYYLASNPDLAQFSQTDARSHYAQYGKQEGRPPCPFALRENLVPIVAEQGEVLEIGPFTNPAIRGKSIKYFDVLDRDALVERAKHHGHPITDAPKIDFVSPIADLSIINERFNAVFSSHVIEHQPDLVEHLKQVGRILKPGGYYFLIIPDRRYCFDHFLANTNLAEVLAAYHEHRRLHSLKSVIEHRALLTHNDAARHWADEHGELHNVTERAERAIDEWENSDGRYIDVHAWQFTPSSFSTLLKNLHQMNLISLSEVQIYPTPRLRWEFCAILQSPISKVETARNPTV